MFITACVLFNKARLMRANYPVDSKGNVCLYDRTDSDQIRPFLYFNDPNDVSGSRLCVSDCPTGQNQVQCF